LSALADIGCVLLKILELPNLKILRRYACYRRQLPQDDVLIGSSLHCVAECLDFHIHTGGRSSFIRASTVSGVGSRMSINACGTHLKLLAGLFVHVRERSTVQRLMEWAEESAGNFRAGALRCFHNPAWTGPDAVIICLQTNSNLSPCLIIFF